MKPPVLLDASFLIDLDRETARGTVGPARTFLVTLRGRSLVVSIVTVAEILEGAVDEDAALLALQRFTIAGLHSAHARRCALLQRRAPRRLGENDAWLVATSDVLNAEVVGADRAAFERLGARYLRFRCSLLGRSRSRAHNLLPPGRAKRLVAARISASVP